jgi:LCP family protein required for cell wall assembly
MPEEKSVDFLRKKYDLIPKRHEKKDPKKSWKILLIISFLILSTGLFASFNLFSSASNNQSETFTLFDPIRRLIANDNGDNFSDQDRLNILLLGIGGAGHDGPELTDTIIIASIKPSTGEVAMLSVPRDLTVPIPGRGWRKINHANAYGELNKKGSGPELASTVVSDIFGINIDYYIKVDFRSFEQIIDAIGGVDIFVDRPFIDNQYPDNNNGYEVLTFEQGWQNMNGSRALKYARSRHGNNGEGSDFARAARQQKVITAVKDKLLSTSTILNPTRLNQVIQVFNRNVTTNIPILEMIRLAKLAPEIKNDKIKNHVLDDSPRGPLYPSTINGAYVLLPRKDDWSELRFLANNLFESEINFSTAKSLRAPTREVKISIQNGTNISGLANEAANIFMSSGFTVNTIDNANRQDYTKTLIFDLTKGQKSSELAILKDFLQAEVIQSIEGWLNSPEILPKEVQINANMTENADFLIILGQNSQNIVSR